MSADETRRVRVVAVDTMNAFAIAAREIPVSAHATMRAVLKVSPLRSVTLRAKTERFRRIDVLAGR